jgi:quercetin dioxygenase-like cupin family protein
MMTAGITPAAEAVDGLSWNILGQTYIPKQLSANSFSWHATLPAGSFVPPHSHDAQDEFLYILEGRLVFWLEGEEKQAGPGDLARLPMGRAHGIFNKSDQTAKCLFWVSPARRLFDLFKAIHNVPDPAEVVRIAALHEVHFLPEPK